ncbi:hypothetical protein FDZ74_03235, partial [bacterium]
MAGLALISTGIVILVEQYIKTGWLILVALPLIGAVFFAALIRQQRLGTIIPGCLILTAGIGVLMALNVYAGDGWAKQLGAFLLAFAFGFALISIVSHLVSGRATLWPLIPAGALASIGACFFSGDLSLVNFVLFIVTGFGLVLLLTGVYT